MVNSYMNKKIQKTFCTVMICGMLNGSIGMNSQPQPKSNYSRKGYVVDADSDSSYGSVKNAYTGNYNTGTILEFEDVITNFYTKLVSDQQPLEKEFEDVLFDNLWDMYQS